MQIIFFFKKYLLYQRSPPFHGTQIVVLQVLLRANLLANGVQTIRSLSMDGQERTKRTKRLNEKHILAYLTS
ncbi:uncharacterized protein Dana_GF26959 [Drosophila ananassae]|uniref:Uncharacterized protein n=1 Tax=Drosophila ananassae TaxID=7217 RepID=A0A0P9AHN6_DROAN|nr:uncharacterized protein Dana_GF26959 [Drosophila ananassae]